MPKIQWTGLPPALRDHRLRERRITAEDLYQLKLWRESEPEAPDGLWYRDRRSFKICGEGKYPKTFLLAGQPAKGKKNAKRCKRPCTYKRLLDPRTLASNIAHSGLV